jgi:hypothetical protein
VPAGRGGPRLAAAAATALGAALLGAGIDVLALAIHREVWRPGSLTLPWGLLLGLATSLACGVAAAILAGRRLGGMSFTVGWIAVLFLALQGRPEGDFVVAADPLGWAFLAIGVTSMGLLLGWAVLGRSGR